MDIDKRRGGPNNSVFKIEISKLKKFAEQPRNDCNLDDESIETLSRSIMEFGQVSPLILSDDNEVLAGERRWKAAEKARLKTINAIYLEKGQDPLSVAVIDNIERKNLLAVEQCEALHKLFKKKKAQKEETGEKLTQEKFGKMFNLKKSSISEIFSIAYMPEKIRDMFRDQPNASIRELKKIAISGMDEQKRQKKAEKYLERLKKIEEEQNSNGKKQDIKNSSNTEKFQKRINRIEKSLSMAGVTWDKLSLEEKKGQIKDLKHLKKIINQLITKYGKASKAAEVEKT